VPLAGGLTGGASGVVVVLCAGADGVGSAAVLVEGVVSVVDEAVVGADVGGSSVVSVVTSVTAGGFVAVGFTGSTGAVAVAGGVVESAGRWLELAGDAGLGRRGVRLERCLITLLALAVATRGVAVTG
jgi:hypothetical protein